MGPPRGHRGGTPGAPRGHPPQHLRPGLSLRSAPGHLLQNICFQSRASPPQSTKKHTKYLHSAQGFERHGARNPAQNLNILYVSWCFAAGARNPAQNATILYVSWCFAAGWPGPGGTQQGAAPGSPRGHPGGTPGAPPPSISGPGPGIHRNP